MGNKGITKIPLFDPITSKMECPLFGVPTVLRLKQDYRGLENPEILLEKLSELFQYFPDFSCPDSSNPLVIGLLTDPIVRPE